MAGAVHIPWYATGFRGDKLEAALAEIAPIALRYGATSYAVYRSDDDLYKFLQVATFKSHDDWDAYWAGPEFVRFRTLTSSWYQVPVLYSWHKVAAEGAMPEVVDLANAPGS
jgi:quinol monooxygenase YgiN